VENIFSPTIFSWVHSGRPDHDHQHCYHHAPKVKSEAVTAVVVAPNDGREDSRNMLSCK